MFLPALQKHPRQRLKTKQDRQAKRSQMAQQLGTGGETRAGTAQTAPLSPAQKTRQRSLRSWKRELQALPAPRLQRRQGCGMSQPQRCHCQNLMRRQSQALTALSGRRLGEDYLTLHLQQLHLQNHRLHYRWHRRHELTAVVTTLCHLAMQKTQSQNRHYHPQRWQSRCQQKQ